MHKKWEYHTERFNIGILNQIFKGKKVHKTQFDKLGAEGWELVSVIPVAEPVAFTSVPVTKAAIGYCKREIK